MIINKLNTTVYYTINILAILVGIIYVIYSLLRNNVSLKNIVYFIFLFFIFSIFFAKLYTMITLNFEIGFIKAGLSGYGGLIGGILSTLIYEKHFNQKGKILKYVIIALPLIYSLSKFSCFVRGCCYGIPYNGPLSVIYPHISDESYFPIQLVEVISFMLIFKICDYNKDKKCISYIALILISIFKFLLDFLRFDHISVLITKNQIFSIVLFIITVILFIIKKRKNSII